METFKDVMNYDVLGQEVLEARIKRYDQKQDIVICDLIGQKENVLATDRYFYQSGDKASRRPFDDLTNEDIITLNMKSSEIQLEV